MRFRLLRSGSSGNCTLIEEGGTRILLDAGGFSLKRLREILKETEIDPHRLSGIVISHLHSDHINISTMKFCKEHIVELWVHADCLGGLHEKFGVLAVNKIKVHTFTNKKIRIGELGFNAFEVPHDARGLTCGFRFWSAENETASFAYAADLGGFNDDLVVHFSDTQAIVLESNHDETMLWANPRRHQANKERVIGDNGHLSNTQCAQALLRILGTSKTIPKKIVLAHLSAENNSPETALNAVGCILKEHRFDIPVICASRGGLTEWIEVG